MAKVFRDTGQWIVKQVCSLLGTSCNHQPSNNPTPIPSLDAAITLSKIIDPLVHPCPYALLELGAPQKPGCCGKDRRQVREIHEALSAIGKATLKSTWKICSNRSVRDPGPNYHTWILGFPREGKLGTITGYYLAKNSKWGLFEFCNRIDVRDFSSLRRISPFVITTYCSRERCYALLEPFKSTDFARIVSSTSGALVHVGVHERVPHVVGVRRIVTQARLGANNCPPDSGGIATPGRGSPIVLSTSDTRTIVDSVFGNALDWLIALLGK